jgi:hypothetical protein
LRIEKWPALALQFTKQRRPDLFAKLELSKDDLKLMAKREERLNTGLNAVEASAEQRPPRPCAPSPSR